MPLTDTEQRLLALIREQPLSSPEVLAQQLGTTRAAVNVHVSNLVRKGALLGRGYILPGQAARPRVVVVGGANVDFKARTLRPAVPGTSNPGYTSQAAGGVGRNVAENVARLGGTVALVTAVGDDALGDGLLRDAAAAGVDVSRVLRVPGEPTGTYTAVLDSGGELLVAVAAMSVMDRLTPAALHDRRAALRGAEWVVADGNLPADTLGALLALTAESGARVVFEPVSVPKATRLLPALDAGRAPYAVTPNVDELSALVGRAVPNDTDALREAAQELHARGTELVWVRRGPLGSLLSSPQETHVLPALPADVTDVTGAGDSMLGAFLAALTAGFAPPEAARLGHAAAALTIESRFTVVPDLTLGALQERLKAASGPSPTSLNP